MTMLCLVTLLCLGDEQFISLFSIHVDTVNLGDRKLRSRHGCGGLVLRVFFLFCGGCEGSFKLPRLFLSDELPLNEGFLKNGIGEEKSE